MKQQSAKVEPTRSQGKTKSVPNAKPELTLLGSQVREWYELLRATRMRMTPNNVKAFNTLSDMDGMDFVNLKEVIELLDADAWVTSHNVAIDPQELASEDGKWRFDRWLPVVKRNRAKCPQKPPPSTIDQDMEASRRAMREINAREKARTTR